MSERCACKKPKPCRETDETFAGLLVDVPICSLDAIICDGCHGIIRDWQPSAPQELK